jgi:hypothetical protein
MEVQVILQQQTVEIPVENITVELFGGVPGPAGPTGPRGIDGVIGYDGATGPQGPTGPQGDSVTGPTGLDSNVPGPTGPMGPTGPQGDSVTGPTGADSDVVGPTGPTGPQGTAGTAGSNGADGATGPTGPQGTAGTAGSNGADGATGPTGPQGTAGTAGSNGADGATGPTGPQGTAGTPGSNGADGATGPTGPQGTAGTAGSNGADGATGPTGPQGTAGSQGTAGATGPTGPGVAAGGTTGQHLRKKTTTDYDTEWADEVLGVPAGVFVPFGGPTTNIPTGWLLCDGSEVSKTTYANLWNALNSGGTGIWDTCAKQVTPWGNWSSPTTGNFRLPDLRNQFVRGAGTNQDGVTTTLGGSQADTTAKNGLTVASTITGSTGNDTPDHTHWYNGHANYNAPESGGNNVGAQSGDTTSGASTRHTHGVGTLSVGTSLGNGDAETRPQNAGANYIIKT